MPNNISQKIKLLLQHIYKPISGYQGVCFVIILSMFLIRELAPYLSYGFNTFFLSALILHFLPTYILITYIICLIGTFLNKISKKLSLIWLITATAVTALLSFTDSFLFRYFSNGICAHALYLLLNTNKGEASEFASTYFTEPRFFTLIGFYSATIIAIIAAGLLFKKYLAKKIGKYCSTSIAIILLIAIPTSLFQLNNFTDTYTSKLFNDDPLSICFTPLLTRLNNTAKDFNKLSTAIETCYNANEKIHADCDSCVSKNIILCIGESFIKSHSSLYGYYLNTNPEISKDSANLYMFNNVIAPINDTAACFNNFMSFSNNDDDCEWYQMPLFPAVFKKSGFNVTLYSNQFVQNTPNANMFDIVWSFFLNNSKLDSQLFNNRNKMKYNYDGELASAWKKDKDTMERDSMNLTIIHLMGQHVNANERYPKSFTYFTSKDIKRSDLSEARKQEIANYDNATLYNDYVVSQIIDLYKDEDAIIIYMSDHGDEANDFRVHIGRTFDYTTHNNDCAHCQLDIPFIIYASDIYKKKHPEVIKRIENAVNRPFMTDDLPHLLIELSGIKTSLFKPERSLINDKYNIHRERIIKTFDNQNYNYDNPPKNR